MDSSCVDTIHGFERREETTSSKQPLANQEIIEVAELFADGEIGDWSFGSHLLSEEIPSSKDEKSFSHEQLDLFELLELPAKAEKNDRCDLAEGDSEVEEEIQSNFLDDYCSEVMMRYKIFMLDAARSPKGSRLSHIPPARLSQFSTADSEAQVEDYLLKYCEEICGLQSLYDLQLNMDIHKLSVSHFRDRAPSASVNTREVEKFNCSRDIVASCQMFDIEGLFDKKEHFSLVPSFEASLQNPHVHAHARYYIWHENGKKLMHSHFTLQKVMVRLQGWQFEHDDPESTIACYRYTAPKSDGSGKQLLPYIFCGLAWPDLLETPPVYLLHFVDFVNRSQSIYGEKVFRLREYLPPYVSFTTIPCSADVNPRQSVVEDKNVQEHQLIIRQWNVDDCFGTYVRPVYENIHIGAGSTRPGLQRRAVVAAHQLCLQLDTPECNGELQASPVMIDDTKCHRPS